MPYYGSKGKGYGGPANGMGWGGPPKGPGNGNPRFDFRNYRRTVNRTSKIATTNGAEPSSRAALKRQRSEAIEEMLWDLAHDSETEMVQLWAAGRLWEMYNGKPTARTITVTTDDLSALTDAELAAELERLGGVPAPIRLPPRDDGGGQ